MVFVVDFAISITLCLHICSLCDADWFFVIDLLCV